MSVAAATLLWLRALIFLLAQTSGSANAAVLDGAAGAIDSETEMTFSEFVECLGAMSMCADMRVQMFVDMCVLTCVQTCVLTFLSSASVHGDVC